LTALGLRREIDRPDLQAFPNSQGIAESVLELFSSGAHFEDGFDSFSDRPKSHFYNPLNNGGLSWGPIRGNPSPDWAISGTGQKEGEEFSYRSARSHYLAALTSFIKTEQDREWGLTFQTLGHVVHHLQDMAQPQHVRNDPHLELSDSERTALCGSATLCAAYLALRNPSLYEMWTNQPSIRSRLPSDFATWGYDLSDPQFAASFNQPRAFWGDATGAGIAGFTNHNFLSAGTNFDNRGMFNFPPLDPAKRISMRIEDLCATANPPCATAGLTGSLPFFGSNVTDHYTGGTAYNPYASTYSVFSADLQKRGKEPAYTLNRFNFELAHAFLIPRAVAYSAGLIDYFFRGKLDVIDHPTVPNARLIRNLGAEMMKGTFAFYYDAVDGVRFPVPGARWDNITLPPTDPANPSGGFQISFEPPVPPALPQPKVPGEYMLVFNGDMGEEKAAPGSVGAVVAKHVTVPYSGVLYLAGEDGAGHNVYFRVDKSGVSPLLPGDQAGPFSVSYLSSPRLQERAYLFKQAEVTTGPGGAQTHKTVGLAMNGHSGQTSWIPFPGTGDLRSVIGIYWSAKSPDPAVGSFEFRLVHLDNAGRQANLAYTRRFTDAQGQAATTTGNLRLPDLPADAGFTYPDFGRGLMMVDGTGTSIYPRGYTDVERYGVRLTLSAAPGASVFDLPRGLDTFTSQPDFTSLVPIGDCAVDYVEKYLNGTRPATFVAPIQREEKLSVDIKRTEESPYYADFVEGGLLSYSQLLIAEQLDHSVKEKCLALGMDYSVLANPRAKVNIIYRHQAERRDRTTTTYLLPVGKFQFVTDNYSVQAGDVRYSCGTRADVTGPAPNIVGPIVSHGLLAAADYSYQGFEPCPTQPASVFISGDVGAPKQTLYRPLTGRATDAVYRDERGLVFRDQVLPGGLFLADTSPIGEVFLATPDMSVIVHEPKAGHMPVLTREMIPSGVAKLLAVIWM
jgi:hypothetical protein